MAEATQDVYDVIICGTDLVQSILSSALSRAGKKVLHCDGNDWYGGFDAVLYGGGTLDLFIEQCMDNQLQEKVDNNDAVADVNGVVGKERDSISILPKEKYASLRLHSQTILVQSDKDKTTIADVVVKEDTADSKIEKLAIDIDAVEGEGEGEEEISNESNNDDLQAPDSNKAIDEVDGFSLDISPCLLYACGDAVEGMVKSGVSDYLEFKSVEGLFVLMGEDDSSKSSRRVNRHRKQSTDTTESIDDKSSTDNKPLVSYRVPCSKADVFRSKLLSPVDKRRLMKFLQLITDYGMAMASQSTEPNPDGNNIAQNDNEEDISASTTLPASTNNNGEDAIQSVNERRLHRGRALSRPQNKATPSSSDMESLIRCVRDGVSFSDFLRNVAKLPDRLAVVVVYALALSPFGYNTTDEAIDDAMARVSKYSTKDGVEDLLLHVTALGRFGNTAFLTAMYGSGELSQAFCRSGAVYGSTYMLRRPPLRIILEKESPKVSGVVLGGEGMVGFDDEHLDQEILCEHVIVPSTMIDPSAVRNAVRTRTYRRISILRGKLVTAEREQNDADISSETEQRYAIIIPPGTRGLSNQSAIHVLALDDSVCVSPRGKQYTVLHLTMTSPEDCDSHDVYDETLGRAVQHLIESQLSTNENASSVEECHHVSFSFSSGSPNDITEDNERTGLHIAYRDTQSITCDSAFREAKRIFDKICPDADFLGLSKKVEDEIVYRNEEDSDDEKVVLESAVTMIETPLMSVKTKEEQPIDVSFVDK